MVLPMHGDVVQTACAGRTEHAQSATLHGLCTERETETTIYN
jgi:hypothetical protein